MEQDLFRDMPPKYDSEKESVQNELVRSIYSKFTFKYLSQNLQNGFDSNDKENIIESFLSQFLKKFKFITYQFSDPSESFRVNDLFIYSKDMKSCFESFPQYINVIICVEGFCLIIEPINKNVIVKILNNTKSELLNVSKSIDQYYVIEEITSFCKYSSISKVIASNNFILYTIKAITGFIIRRNYYPSNYFNDRSFFIFNESCSPFEIESKKKLADSLFLDSQEKFFKDNESLFTKKFMDYVEQSSISNFGQISSQNFEMNEFINLRTLSVDSENVFYLSIHIKSLYLFVIKRRSNECPKGFANEIFYCDHCRYRCFTRFYGYIKEKESIKGFVYEFMSNGTLEHFILNSKKEIGELYSLMTVCRLFQGMQYLHSHSIVHRDLKPSNILIDHDFVPYISDFNTICEVNRFDEFTGDWASEFYTSPEQKKGEKILLSTDIYSFGLILYFLFEKKHLLKLNPELVNSDIEVDLKASQNFNEIFHGCVKYQKDKRITIDEIFKRLYNEVFSFSYLERYLFENIDQLSIQKNLVHYFFESIFIVYGYTHDIDQMVKCVIFLRNFFILKLTKETEGYDSFLYELGTLFVKSEHIKNDLPKAIEYFKLAGKANNAKALFALGNFYLIGNGVQRDPSKAIQYFELAAKLKNPGALIIMGDFYFKGNYFPKNVEKAIECFTIAANQGEIKAYLQLGIIYASLNEHSKAIPYLQIAANFNNPEAQLDLGIFYYEGSGVDVNYEKAFQYFKLAALHNNPIAYSKLGDLYFNGYGVEQSYSLAREYYELSLQYSYLNDSISGISNDQHELIAKLNRVKYLFNKSKSEVMYNLGYIYLFGKEVECDLEKAKAYFEMSASMYNDKAQVFIAKCYMDGVMYEQNFAKARELFELSAGNENAYSIYILGEFYFYGLGVEIDYQQAFNYYSRSATLGYCEANHKLGNLYFYGVIVQQDHQKAIKYFQAAYQLGSRNACAMLGYLYYEGYIVKDFSKAIHFYQELANENNPIGLFKLGEIYISGKGVEQDIPKGIQLLELAAKYGSPEAQLKLGCLLLSNNFGRPNNYSKVLNYLQLSASKGNSKALYFLGMLCLHGIGCRKNSQIAIEYLERAAKYKNLESLFLLAMIYQEGGSVKVSIPKSIEYFQRCIEIEDNRVEYLHLKDKSVISSIRSSAFYYMALNNLGLIYLTKPSFENSQLGIELIKSAGSNEYVFAMNNYGIVLQFFNGREDDAYSKFDKAAKNRFPLSEYNIGHLLEKRGQFEESLKYYIDASLHEDVILKFRDQTIIDESLEISKTFIICLTNLKLVCHFLKQSNFDDAKKFFIRSLSKLINLTQNTENEFHFNINGEVNVFKFLRNFIIEFPLFNLRNQPNFELEKFLKNIQPDVDNKNAPNEASSEQAMIDALDRICQANDDVDDDDGIEFKNLNLLHKKKFDLSDGGSDEENCDQELRDDGMIKDSGGLFDFIVHDRFYSSQFLFKICEIVNVLDSILYSKPYPILLGRIYLNAESESSVANKNERVRDINGTFYEGLGNVM